MTIYSFRAECQTDADALHNAILSAQYSSSMRRVSHLPFPDVDVELLTDASLETLRQLLRGIVDSHVMTETLRPCPLPENSLRRTKLPED